MPKKILAICSSPIKYGNPDTLVDAFIKGAFESGHFVERIKLSEHDIHPPSFSKVL